MKFDIDGIKALEFESRIDNTWWSMKTDYDKTLINKLLEQCGICYDREDIMDWGNYRLSQIINKYGLKNVIKGFKTYVPSDIENVWGDSSEVTCICEDCSYVKEKQGEWLSCYSWFGSCWEDLVIYVTIAVMIGGNNAKKEMQENWGISRMWIDRICDNRIGWFEKELYEEQMSIDKAVLKFKKMIYGGEDMFFKEFSKFDDTDYISVFWVDDLMYVNDEHNHQAVAQVSLFEAYKFAILINACNFDYEANDEEVKNLGEKLLTLIDRDECPNKNIINIWDYFDNISDDFEKLTGKKLGIDEKRIIVANITDVGDDKHSIGSLECWGSATFIASLLFDYVKGNEYKNIKGCDNKIINKLTDDYLQSDEYDLRKFAEELHKKANQIKTINVDGSLWINNCKYEYVDDIVVDNEEVHIYWEDMNIGYVLVKDINSIKKEIKDGIIEVVLW